MGNIKRLAKALLNPIKKMENTLNALKKDYDIEPNGGWAVATNELKKYEEIDH